MKPHRSGSESYKQLIGSRGWLLVENSCWNIPIDVWAVPTLGIGPHKYKKKRRRGGKVSSMKESDMEGDR